MTKECFCEIEISFLTHIVYEKSRNLRLTLNYVSVEKKP